MFTLGDKPTFSIALKFNVYSCRYQHSALLSLILQCITLHCIYQTLLIQCINQLIASIQSVLDRKTNKVTKIPRWSFFIHLKNISI